MKRTILFFSLLGMAGIYGSFLAIDIYSGFSSNIYSVTVRYLCILTCLILVFSAGEHAFSKKDLKLVKLAFVFTAGADFMMSMICTYPFLSFGNCDLIKKYKFGVGVLLFIGMQIVFIIRHKQGFVWNRKEGIAAFLIFFLMAFKVWEDVHHYAEPGIGFNNLLLVLLLVYAIILCTSTWMAIGTLWRGVFPRQTAWLIAVGMFLFFLCDNSLGRYIIFPETVPIEERSSFIITENRVHLAKVTKEGGKISVYTAKDKTQQMIIPYTPKTIAGILVWLFYLPAQVLLMLSTFKPSFLRKVIGLFEPMDT